MRLIAFLIILYGITSIGCVSNNDVSNENKNGRIIHLDSFPSEVVAARDIDVWLPANYDSTKRYAVIYAHNGQMLFDTTHTLNHQEWGMDETMTRLMNEGKIRDAIVVGISNVMEKGESDYFPEAILTDLNPGRNSVKPVDSLQQGITGDEYLMFVVLELKPYIDSAFLTLPDQANTFIMGSSRGALISLYALCEYPRIFGGAACISTHWPVTIPVDTTNGYAEKFIAYLDQYLPAPEDHKVYFDHGTATLDSLYKPYQTLVDSIMVKHGYTSQNWMTKEFARDEHTEAAWSKRLHIPLEFLLRK